MSTINYFLFSIDLEDTTFESSGKSGSITFQKTVYKYLKFFEEKKMKTTFFTLGRVATIYPSLVKEIYASGHEIACHSYQHIPITKQHRIEFKDDLLKCLAAFAKIDIYNIKGYRAPLFSLIEDTSWAYKILEELGFTYSSSVLPANNPLFGWNKYYKSNIAKNKYFLEFPISLNSMYLPLGGVYLRALPFLLTKRAVKNIFKHGKPIFSYLHPYDISSDKSAYAFPSLGNNYLYRWIMKYNREVALSRVNEIVDTFDAKIIPYAYFKDKILQI